MELEQNYFAKLLQKLRKNDLEIHFHLGSFAAPRDEAQSLHTAALEGSAASVQN